MNRKLKVLGLALVAVCAMSVVAAGAQARSFTASSYPATGTGEQPAGAKHVFTVQGQKVECEKAHFQGSLSAISHSITITPTYSGCTAFGFLNAEVKMNGCTYEFTIDNTGVEPANGMHIRCPAGQTITVVASTCTVHIPAQTPTVNNVDYVNGGGGVLVTSTVEGIHSATTDGFLCPLESSKETDTTGKYAGSVQFNGTGGKTIDVG